MKSINILIIAGILGLIPIQQAFAHAYACHRLYSEKEVTLNFYKNSFKASEILHLGVLQSGIEADNYLEQGVLADINGKPAEKILKKALAKFVESRKNMDELYDQIGVLRKIDKNNKALPEHKTALQRILKAHPPIERVSLTTSRFSNVSRASGIAINYGTIGVNFDDLLSNLQLDLRILQEEYDQTIDAFSAVMPLAKDGGFAAMVLSGRAPLPEKIMHVVDQLMVYVQFSNRACVTSIAADMQVYPKGLEWLPKVRWKKEKGAK